MTRPGLGLFAGGVAAIGYTWWYWADHGQPGPVVLAMIGVLAAAIGALMTGGGLAGRRGVLGAGLGLFAAGIVSVLTDRLYYWLPNGWNPIQVMVAGAAILGLIAAIGTIFDEFSLGGLSAVCGVLALCALVGQETPDAKNEGLGEVLKVAAITLAVVAASAGLGMYGGGRSRRDPRRLAAVAACGVSALVIVLTAVNVWPHLPSEDYISPAARPAVAIMAAMGAIGVIWLGISLWRRTSAPSGRVGPPADDTRPPPPDAVPPPLPRTDPTPRTDPRPRLDPRPRVDPSPSPSRRRPSVAAAEGAAAESRSWLQTTATVVGILGGTITILKELAGLFS
jgi:hypothetical protein